MGDYSSYLPTSCYVSIKDIYDNDKEHFIVLDAKTVTTNKYVAPNMREGGAGRGLGREMRRDDVAAIRISNLSNFAVEADLDDLVKGFGPVQKLYLAKEKVTSHSHYTDSLQTL